MTAISLYTVGTWRSNVKVSARLDSSEASVLALEGGCLPSVSSRLLSAPVRVQISSSYKHTICTELGPAHMTSFKPNYVFTESISQCSHSLRCWALGLPHTKFVETQLAHDAS